MPRRVRRAIEFAAPTVVSVALMLLAAPFRPASSYEVETWVHAAVAGTWWLGLSMAVIGLPSMAVGVLLALLEIRQSGPAGPHAPVLFSTLAASGASAGYLCWLYSR